ncbi:MAG: hypothetical protein L0287_34325 [Anaerolineae bacterium]|nr:hypothetical protein [Anaerolineae bacterium]
MLRDKDGHFSDQQKEALAYELGDVLWYLVNCAEELGYGFDTIATLNQIKIHDRMARGVLKGSGDNR